MWKPPRTTLLTISSALLVVAPKCPVCFLAYFGIFGVATASVSVYRAWLAPVTAVWLAFTVGMLAFQRGGQRAFGPAVLGLCGAVGVFVGKFILNDQLPVYAGIAALVAAVVWRALLQRLTSGELCLQCDLQLLSDDARSRKPSPNLRNFGAD